MKNLKEERGAIAILVLVTVLFFVTFLITTFFIISSKAQMQEEIIEQTRAAYDNTDRIEEMYNSFFGNTVIPIYTTEQLLKIGTEEIIKIDEKYYTFKNDEFTKYILMSDIEIIAYEEDEDYYWEPIGDRQDLEAKLVGNNHKINVKYKDDENEEYTVTYSEEYNFSEPEYKVTIIPKASIDDDKYLEEAIIYSVSGENDETIVQEGIGKTEISIKRLQEKKIYAECAGHYDSEQVSVYVENPNKIEPINIILDRSVFTFSINAKPVTAKVTINGAETNSVTVNKGDTVTWKVEATNYNSQEGSQVVNSDTTLDIDLSIIKYTLTIVPEPSDATVKITSNGEELISGKGTQSVLVNIGTNLSYSVEQLCYHTQTSDVIMNQDYDLDVLLELKPEEEPMVLTPSSVEAEDWTSVGNGKGDITSGSYASSWNTDKFYFYFDASAIDENAKIVSIVASYKLGQSIAGNDVNVILDANGTQCLSTTTENIPIAAGGKIYEASATTLPRAADVKAGLTLSINNVNGGADILRIYGARLTIRYINP